MCGRAMSLWQLVLLMLLLLHVLLLWHIVLIRDVLLLCVALWSLIERALGLLLLIDLLLFPALTLLLSPQEPVMIWRSISWGRRQGSRT